MSDTSKPAGLSRAHLKTLASLLDRIIPGSPDGRLPGAGALGLAPSVGEGLGQMPALLPLVAQGLDALHDLARGRGADDFSALSDANRDAVLNVMGERDPGFLPGLVFHCYTAYYRDPRVIEWLGLEARPPFPQGYEMEPNDFSDLQAVRERAPMFRKVGASDP